MTYEIQFQPQPGQPWQLYERFFMRTNAHSAYNLLKIEAREQREEYPDIWYRLRLVKRTLCESYILDKEVMLLE